MASLNLLTQLVRHVPDGSETVLLLLRGVPHNVTTEMDLILWQTAQTIRSDATAYKLFAEFDADDLSAEFRAGSLPPVAQQALNTFMIRYGMRGLAEIDLGRRRWREEPTQVIRTVQSYLRIDDPTQAPHEVFARGQKAAEDSAEKLIQMVRHTPGGFIKVRIVRVAVRRIRALAGLRESPKFTIMQMFGLVRHSLLVSGAQLAAEGVLDSAEDVFWLTMPELKTLAKGNSKPNWQSLVAERRHTYARETQRRQIPRILLSDGQAFYEGVSAETDSDDPNQFNGTPVSPGVVEGIVRVVFDPSDAQLQPGDILVCPGTDPAWTPLFLTAGGLITEVGGLMTHGSVVAREYGIPAVVGVNQATQRLQTGQRVRVDGSSGLVVIMSDSGESNATA
jgi:pyruvate,water dikinase